MRKEPYLTESTLKAINYKFDWYVQFGTIDKNAKCKITNSVLSIYDAITTGSGFANVLFSLVDDIQNRLRNQNEI